MRHINFSTLIFWSLTVFGDPTVASIDGPAIDSLVLCKNKKTVRSIRIEKSSEDNTWVTYYSKLGVDKIVARAQLLDSCIKVADNIKENLEKAEWQCKEHKKVSSTEPNSSDNKIQN